MSAASRPRVLQKWGISNFIEFDWWDQHSVAPFSITCTPAQHFSGRSMRRNKTLWCSWVVQGEQTFFFGGDSGYFDGFAAIGDAFEIDVAALPIGAYAPYWFMHDVHMNPKEAITAFQNLHAKYFIPIHWGSFDLADEPLDEPIELLRQNIQGLDRERFWLLNHGEIRST